MRKILFATLTLVLTNSVFSQTHLFENPNFDEIAKEHKIIGVVPFKASVSLRPKEMKKISAEKLKAMGKSEGQSIQNAMYSWFLKRKKRGTLTVDVQNPTITNAKLNKAGITPENFEEYTPSELAKLLDLDAIIMGTFETDKPMSEGASVALGLLIGFWGTTNTATINLSIFDAVDGELLVNYYKKVRGSLGSDNDMLINRIMRKASRRIAYTK